MKRWFGAQKVGVKGAIIGGCFALAAAVLGGGFVLLDRFLEKALPSKPIVVILQTAFGPELTPAPSATIAPTPTSTERQTISAAATLSTPTSAPYCAGRLKPATPCRWIVEPNDSFEVIALAVYGSRQQMLALENANRDSDGYRRRLHPGDEVLVPSTGASLSPQYPTCILSSEGGGTFPCLYLAQPGETYYIIARRYYGLSSMSMCVSAANIRFDGVNIAPLASSPDEDVGGNLLVLPAQNGACP